MQHFKCSSVFMFRVDGHLLSTLKLFFITIIYVKTKRKYELYIHSLKHIRYTRNHKLTYFWRACKYTRNHKLTYFWRASKASIYHMFVFFICQSFERGWVAIGEIKLDLFTTTKCSNDDFGCFISASTKYKEGSTTKF